MGTTVSNIGELNAAIVAADSATAPGTLTIDFAAGTSISLRVRLESQSERAKRRVSSMTEAA